MLRSNSGDSKTTCKTLKQLLPKCSAGGIASLEVNGNIVINFTDICNVFNNFFTDTSESLARSIRKARTCPLD